MVTIPGKLRKLLLSRHMPSFNMVSEYRDSDEAARERVTSMVECIAGMSVELSHPHDEDLEDMDLPPVLNRVLEEIVSHARGIAQQR